MNIFQSKNLINILILILIPYYLLILLGLQQLNQVVVHLLNTFTNKIL